ncbi:MAG: hypothetical protein Kow0060_06210 [Methylohalobius crimeensis]
MLEGVTVNSLGGLLTATHYKVDALRPQPPKELYQKSRLEIEQPLGLVGFDVEIDVSATTAVIDS